MDDFSAGSRQAESQNNIMSDLKASRFVAPVCLDSAHSPGGSSTALCDRNFQIPAAHFPTACYVFKGPFLCFFFPPRFMKSAGISVSLQQPAGLKFNT